MKLDQTEYRNCLPLTDDAVMFIAINKVYVTDLDGIIKYEYAIYYPDSIHNSFPHKVVP